MQTDLTVDLPPAKDFVEIRMSPVGHQLSAIQL
jgi:hypothetical protein